jgi:hypothetical protein
MDARGGSEVGEVPHVVTDNGLAGVETRCSGHRFAVITVSSAQLRAQLQRAVLHSIFERAVRDQLILINPCEHTELPKIIVRRTGR